MGESEVCPRGCVFPELSWVTMQTSEYHDPDFSDAPRIHLGGGEYLQWLHSTRMKVAMLGDLCIFFIGIN